MSQYANAQHLDSTSFTVFICGKTHANQPCFYFSKPRILVIIYTVPLQIKALLQTEKIVKFNILGFWSANQYQRCCGGSKLWWVCNMNVVTEIWSNSTIFNIYSCRNVTHGLKKFEVTWLGGTVPLIVKNWDKWHTKTVLVLEWLNLFPNTFCGKNKTIKFFIQFTDDIGILLASNFLWNTLMT